tara:strand:+ start:1336 stop:1557 length:222 start_codon:yes stop_codon:yes gene_type:complete
MLGANNYSGTDLQRIQAQKLLRGSVEVKGNGKLSAELMIGSQRRKVKKLRSLIIGALIVLIERITSGKFERGK